MNTIFTLTSGTNPILESNTSNYKIPCFLNKQHWILIKWYFDRCTFIEITEIALNKSHNNKVSNQIISGLMSGNKIYVYPVRHFLTFLLILETQTSVQTYIVDQFYDEPNITYADTFGRNSVRFEPWEIYRNDSKISKNRPTIRQYTRFSFKSKIKTARHDEPEFAAFVYAESFDIIEDYLVGPPRQPFYKPRGNFIITVTEKAQIDWMESAATILEKLWRDYRVFNVIIMMPCEDKQVW